MIILLLGTCCHWKNSFEKVIPLLEENFYVACISYDGFDETEDIKGKLLLIGASDDVLWNTIKYIRRIERRLKQHPHSCEVKIAIYKYGTHFVYPESMLQMMMPLLGGAFVKLAFVSARRHPKECKRTRMDIDRKLRAAIEEWGK